MGGNDIGMIGLGVMGGNLVLNMAERGFAVAAYNRVLGNVTPLHTYEPGGWGPMEAEELIGTDGPWVNPE